MTHTTLTVGELGRLGEQLGAGGQAVVHDAPGVRLPQVPGELVYKAYRPGKAPRVHDMARLIALRDGLAPVDRARLDQVTAWPLCAVMAGSELQGVVLPKIPSSYFQPVTLPSGRQKRLVREVQHLFVEPARCRRVGMPEATWEQRLLVCRDFAATLDFLHSPVIDVVFGDLNAKNELFRLDAEPTVLFVDCDAVRKRGEVTGEPQLNAPDWEPPRQTSLNRATDRYKLGLFVLRCLSPLGPQASTRTDPADAAGVLDPAGVALLTAALTGPAAQRPSAREWLRYLSRLAGDPLDPPALDVVDEDRTLVPAGEPVTISWTARDAITVEVAGLGVDTVVSDGRPGTGTTQICPVRTGALTVTARNRRGIATRRTPPVSVLDVPDFAQLPVPMPHLTLDAVTLPALPDMRRVVGLTPPMPDLPPPVLTGTTSAARPPETWQPLPRPPADLPGVDLYEDLPFDLVSIMVAGPETDPWRGVFR